MYKSPVYNIIAVPVEKIEPNTYNPNNVAAPELKLLYDSIKEDGYTMPIVCYYDKENEKYIIVDGFHRYRTMMDNFAAMVRGEKKNPYTPDYELALNRFVMRSCGVECAKN